MVRYERLDQRAQGGFHVAKFGQSQLRESVLLTGLGQG